MTSQILNEIGLGGLDIAYLFIATYAIILLLIILIIIQIVKYSRLKKKYNKFMRGKNAESLEQDIVQLYQDNQKMKKDVEKSKRDIRSLFKTTEKTFQKVGIIKYDAFQQMGGKLSFSLALLDQKNNGFVLNSVHSTDGCYSYTKEIKNGKCSIDLGNEEKVALDLAIGEEDEE
ncbi:MAG: DUF4446 family protein [Lachnospiraceae bacterium]|nr:DUF4446 family protein [Lachnospiraceae bacterium]